MTIRKIAKNVILPILFVAICIASFYTQESPKDKTLYRKIGGYELHSGKYGLFLTQPESWTFYNISPYDAYYINEDGYEMSVISWDNKIISNEAVLKQNKLLSKMHSIISYFGQANPKATFTTNYGRTITYSTKTDGNKITFMQENNLTEKNNGWALTLSYNESDFIIDNLWNVYTQNSNTQIEDLEILYNVELTKIESLEQKTPVENVKHLYIVNKSANDVIKLTLNYDKFPNVYINKENKMIELMTDTETEFTIEILSSPKEVFIEQ